MKNITYISASAGSGKTYAITTSLTDIILKGMAEPEQAILTTFTKAAAAELKEKAKAKLCENGLYEQAERLEQAMIGTAHSVAESFIKKYWHILGLSPELNVMTDEDVDFYRNQSLYTVPKGKELSFLHDFAEEFGIKYKFGSAKHGINYDFWKDHLKSIIEYSVNYGISNYEKSKEESKKFITSLCEKDLKRENLPDDEEIKKKFIEIIKEDEKIKVSGEQEKRKKSTESIIRHNRLSFSDLYTLSGIVFPKPIKGKDEYKNLFEDLPKIFNTEEARDVQIKYIDTIFGIAERWKKSFEQYKKEKRLIDYSDMEKYFLQLLKNEDVKKDIKAKYKFLFVDEFQDCSQNQVKIFDTISDLMQHSYWVGDFKQSIFAFRGTDTKLAQAVADIVKDKENSSVDTLKTSYRSLPVLVEAANKSFVSAFRNTIKKEQVELSPCNKKKEEAKNFKEEPLRFLPLGGNNKAENFVLLANYIASLVKKGIKPKEIAVLARNKGDFIEETISLPILLRFYGIPVNQSETKQISGFAETDLLLAMLSIVANNNDSLAKAKILFYTQKGYDSAKIANVFIKKGDIAENEIISKIISNKKYKKLPVCALVKSLIIDFNLSYELRKCALFVNPEIFDIIAEYALEYEQSCLNLSVPATIEGFIEKVKNISLETNGEDSGITLTTYHKAKGLEWKYVILYSLDSRPVDTTKFIKRNIYGVRTIHEKPTSSCLYPETSIIVLPWIYGSKLTVPASTLNLLKKKYPGLDKDIDNNSSYGEGWPHTEIAKERAEEEKRLMYVGMTRASHCLILATQTKQAAVENKSAGKIKKKKNEPEQEEQEKTVPQLSWLKQIGINAVQEIIPGTECDFLGIGMNFHKETVPEIDADWQYNPHNREFTVNPAENTANYVLRDQSPSGQNGGDVNVNIIYPENYSAGTETARINLKNVSADEMAETGSCIHDIFCVLEYINGEARNAKAAAIIQDYGFAGKINPEQVVQAWDNLAKLLSEKYGRAAATYHELPFQYAKEGQIFTGSIDYVYELPENKVILVDYKSFPGRIVMITDKDYEDKKGEKGTHYAGKYKGQFDCYEHALTAAGKTVIAKIIYYPVAGIAVEIK